MININLSLAAGVGGSREGEDGVNTSAALVGRSWYRIGFTHARFDITRDARTCAGPPVWRTHSWEVEEDEEVDCREVAALLNMPECEDRAELLPWMLETGLYPGALILVEAETAVTSGGWTEYGLECSTTWPMSVVAVDHGGRSLGARLQLALDIAHEAAWEWKVEEARAQLRVARINRRGTVLVEVQSHFGLASGTKQCTLFVYAEFKGMRSMIASARGADIPAAIEKLCLDPAVCLRGLAREDLMDRLTPHLGHACLSRAPNSVRSACLKGLGAP